MTELRQRREPIRSEKYLAGARGEDCKLRLDGCRNERDTVVSTHLSSLFGGMGVKCGDILVIDGCWRCHNALDRRTHGLNDAELYEVLLRALAETLEARHRKGLLIVPLDSVKPLSKRATPPRKPPEQRRKIPPGRKLQSRNDLKREARK